jgi:hypothetical protein
MNFSKASLLCRKNHFLFFKKKKDGGRRKGKKKEKKASWSIRALDPEARGQRSFLPEGGIG